MPPAGSGADDGAAQLPSGDDGPHAFVDDIDAPVLADDDRHHLERALRLRAGDLFTVSDGSGRWRRCRLGDPVEVVDAPLTVPPPEPSLTVAVALVKGQRPELVVQKLTELGIDHIVLFSAERSVVRWDTERAEKNLVRLARVSREAAMQSRQVRLPTVAFASAFEDVAALPGAVLADRSGDNPARGLRTLLIGPEGGWSAAERETPLGRVRLADGVLRAETAAIAAGVVLAGLRSARIAAP